MAQDYCEKCGNAVQPKDLYCVKCGSRLGSKISASATPVQKQSSNSIPPISPEQQQKTPVASANPFTNDVVIKSGMLLFKCPTCPSNINVPLQNIDPIVGISVLCSNCKNIIHVPGMYKTEPKPAGMRIGEVFEFQLPIFPIGTTNIHISHPLLKIGNPTLFSIMAYGLFVIPVIINMLQLCLISLQWLRSLTSRILILRVTLCSMPNHLNLQTIWMHCVLGIVHIAKTRIEL